jgi:hypothetical protein
MTQLRPTAGRRRGVVARTLSVLAVAIAVLALNVPAASAQVPPPTLTGETFLGGLFTTEPSSLVTSASCNPTGTSTFTYQATGPAAGPYVGTYTETGTVTIGPQVGAGTPPTGTVTSWTASFTIASATGNVTGSKSLPPDAPPVAGICTEGSDVFIAQRSAATGVQNVLAYTATITAPDGTQYSDHGRSAASVNDFPTEPSFDNFFEQFESEQATTTPLCNQDDQSNQNQGGNNQGCKNP